jgi:hypothetical protein
MGLQILHKLFIREKIHNGYRSPPLTWIFNDKDPSSRLLRWRLKLEEYEYEVIYKKGSNNTNADAVSRIHVTEGCTDSRNSDSKLTKEEKEAIFQEKHNKPIGGHLGMNRTYDRLKLFTTWPGMKQELEEYIRQCETCQKNKITQNKTKMPIKITTTPEVFFWGEMRSRHCRSLESNVSWKQIRFNLSGRTF